MGRQHVSHADIANWAVEKVNLPKEKASAYREQANRLREKVQTYISDHPDFTLRKMLLSGSLAKGTALRSLNDIDIACYISGADAPHDIPKLLDYLAERLRKAFPNFTPDQVKPQTFSVTVSFKGSGLDVDIVPVLYYDDPDWYGKLVSQQDGSFLDTCIPRHLEFIRKRKAKNQLHFAQVIRLLKYWVRNQKMENDSFKFKSFMIELILSKLSDDGLDFSDYPEAMQHFYTYLAKSNLKEIIVFGDYYSIHEAAGHKEPIKIIDPVNSKNNASKLYTNQQAQTIINAALDAGDAIDSALSATTKEKTIYYWQKVFGSTFNI